MKLDNLNMNNNTCEEIQLLIEDYLDGMISTENKKRMEEHVSACTECKSYLEYTVMLIDNTVKMAREDNMPGEKKEQIWNGISEKITASPLTKDSQIFNMSGLEDEYIPPVKKEESYYTESTWKWSSVKYYVSGLAAVFALAFLIYIVSQYRQGSELNVIQGNIVDIGTKWKVNTVKGSPMIDGLLMKNNDSISLGQYIITDDSSRAELYVASLGTVIIEPNSKIKFVKSVEGEHRIELVYGTVDANILAKPRSFFVDAGKVSAVDLGCAYKISMDESGDGLLYVKSGRVSLETAGGRESMVPEGKFCVLKKDIGPGTPFRSDTSPRLKKALMDFDFGDCGNTCVNVILKNASKKDAVTLLNIMPRVDEEYKNKVYAQVSGYCSPPKNMPKDSIPKCDKIEKLNVWIDKVMEEVHKNIEESMKVMEENMKNFDAEKWNKNWDKNFGENWKHNYYQSDSTVKYDFNFEVPEIPDVPNTEDMKELQENLNEMQRDLKHDNEDFKREMEQFKIEMQRVAEEIKKEAKEKQKDTQEELRDKQEKQKDNEDKMKDKKERMDNDKEKPDSKDENTPDPDNDNN
jgi:putative zinc finger protein